MKVNGIEYFYRVEWDEERFIVEPCEYGLPGNYAIMHMSRDCRDMNEVNDLIKKHGTNKNYVIESTYNSEFRLIRVA